MKNQLIKFLGVSIIALGTFSCQNDLISTESALTSADFAIAARSATDHIAGKRDSIGKGYHHKMTKIDIAALPTVITSHITTNYAGFTINHAAKHDSTGNFSVGISKDTAHKHLSYTAAGVFIKETAKGSKGKFNANEIVLTELNAAIKTYITTNYAAATIHKAFKDVNNNTMVILKDGTTAKVLTFNVTNVFVSVADFTKQSKGKKNG